MLLNKEQYLSEDKSIKLCDWVNTRCFFTKFPQTLEKTFQLTEFISSYSEDIQQNIGNSFKFKTYIQDINLKMLLRWLNLEKKCETYQQSKM